MDSGLILSCPNCGAEVMVGMSKVDNPRVALSPGMPMNMTGTAVAVMEKDLEKMKRFTLFGKNVCLECRKEVVVVVTAMAAEGILQLHGAPWC